MRIVRGLLMLVSLVVMIYAIILAADPGYQIQGIPPNLVIVYDIGATHAAWGRTRYVVTADGRMKQFDLRGIAKPDEKPASTCTIPPEGLKRIIDTINRNRFFKLAPSYEDPSVMDGSSMYISVQAGNVSKMVSARNTAVAELHEISKAILAEAR